MKRTICILTTVIAFAGACGDGPDDRAERGGALPGSSAGTNPSEDTAGDREAEGHFEGSQNGEADDLVRPSRDGSEGAEQDDEPGDPAGGDDGTRQDSDGSGDGSGADPNEPDDDSGSKDDDRDGAGGSGDTDDGNGAGGNGGGDVCVSAPHTVGHCVCGDFRSKFASTDSPLGVNGDFTVDKHSNIEDLLTVAGAGGVSANDGDFKLHRQGDLRTNGPVFSTDLIQIGGDAEVAGDITAWDVHINGTLTQPAGSTVNATDDEDIGQEVQGAVAIPNPCDCNNVVDIAGTIAQHQNQNDNAAAGLGVDAIQNAPSVPRPHDPNPSARELDLPPGTYYFDGADLGTEALAITSLGDLEIYVDGELKAGDLDVTMPSGKRLQLWVRDDFELVDSGAESRGEAHFRVDPSGAHGGIPFDLYVGGASLRIDITKHDASVTAPNATINGGSRFTIHGGRVLAAEFDYDGIVQLGRIGACRP